MWTASLGNLGAYTLVAKGVNPLVAMGIGIAILIDLAISLIFDSSFEECFAKNIIKEYDKKDGLGQFKIAIEKYWTDTKSAFIKAVNNLRDSYVEYLDDLREKTKIDDTQIINQIKNESTKLEFISKLLNQIEK